MAVQNLPIVLPDAPEGFCPATWQAFINFLRQGYAQLTNGNVQLLSQSNQPDPDQRVGFVWHDPDTGLIYKYVSGAWIAPNLIPPASPFRRIWVGTEAALWSADGGDGTNPAVNTPTGATGAMWIVDTVMTGAIPQGVGAIPGSDPVKTLALLEAYGAGTQTLNDTVLGGLLSHVHLTGWPLTGANPDFYLVKGSLATQGLVGGREVNAVAAFGNTSSTPASSANGYANTGPPGKPSNAVLDAVKVPMTPPVVGVYFAKRSGRTSYLGS